MRHNYDYIPQSILIFKENQIIYANQYMKTMFLADDYSLLSLTLRKMLNIETEEQLFNFFKTNKYFECDKKTITSTYVKKEYDLFIFNIVDEALEHDSSHPVLKQINTSQLEVISFFRGIKLQSSEKILQIKKDSLILHLSKKQRLNLFDNREFFICVDNEYYHTKCKSYEIESDKVELDNITPVSHHALDRNEVRLQVDSENIYLPFIEKHVELFDISEKSISFNSKENFSENELQKIKSLNLYFLETSIIVTYFKTTKVDEQYHYIFLIEEPPHQLTEFIHEKQRNILFEFANTVHKF